MQYVAVFLAVLVVLIGMNGFMFFTLRQICRQIRAALTGRLLRELSVFDELYEEKEKRLEELKARKALLDSNIFPREAVVWQEEGPVGTAVMPAAEIPVSQTSNPDFYEEYRYVKHAFAFDFDRLIGLVMAAPKDPDWSRGGSADAFLAAVPDATALELSTLEGMEQLQILEQTLKPEAAALIPEYLQQAERTAQDFSILECLSHIKNISRLYRDEVTVYTGTGSSPPLPPGVRVVDDPFICEGIRIMRGNRLYDYSF